MGIIADKVASMRGARLSEIVAEIARMEADTLDVGGDEFQKVWDNWPNKTAKKAAEKAYRAARKRGISAGTIVAGMMRYVATKPADRPWLHLATFINGERWNDQPAPVATPQPKGLAGVRAQLQEEIANGERDAGPSGDHYPDARRLAIGSRFDDERNRGRLL